jgi:tripartite-type tricarboxylate transporter receptor subunit TctC
VGGSTGYTARVAADALQQHLGLAVTLDARPGRFGINAIAELVGRSDAGTLMVGTIITNSMTPVWHRDEMAFDYDDEIVPVTRLADFPSVVMVSPAARADTLGEFIADVKHRGGRLMLGADFVGSFGEVDALMLAKATGVEVAFHSNPDGAAGLLEDLLTGKSNFTFLNVATASANAGRFKPLAVTGPARLANFPDVPTMAEAGFPGIGTINWQGLFAPRRIAPDMLAALHRAAVAAMSSAPARAALAEVNATVNTSELPDAFAAAINAEMTRWELLRPQIMGVARE